jgi:hypothetical protein
MEIDQRNAGASVTPADGVGTYTLDRWRAFELTDGSFSVQQDSSAPNGFVNSLKITVVTTDSSLGADQQAKIEQMVEGFNVADLNWGTANAQTVTLSFWVRSSVTGTFGGAIHNLAADRSYPFTYTINSTDTWEYKSVTIPGDTTGTWVINNGIGFRIPFSLGAGSNRSGTAGAWNTNNNISATGATNLMATAGATFYITGVQLEKGSTATPFERRQFGTELALCQRYFTRLSSGATGYVFSSTLGDFGVQFPTTMRATPSVTHLANYDITNPATATYTVTATILSSSSTGTNGLMIRCTSSGMSAATCIISSANNIGFNSEL